MERVFLKSLLCFFVGITLPICAQTSPQAVDLLVRSASAIFGAGSVRLTGKITVDVTGPGTSQNTEASFTEVYERGGRGRLTLQTGNAVTTILFDGSSLWNYSSVSNSYTHTPAKSLPENGVLGPLAFGRSSENILSAAILKQEPVEFAGIQIACDVVRATYKSAPANSNAAIIARTVWIARDSTQVLRDVWENEIPMRGGRAESSHDDDLFRDRSECRSSRRPICLSCARRESSDHGIGRPCRSCAPCSCVGHEGGSRLFDGGPLR